MATHALGKLKFNVSKNGLAYRWGDGEIKRLFGGKKAAAATDDDYNDGNAEYEGEDGYSDPGYDDGYADDGYDDDGYGDGNYDDRYSDEDAGEGYYQSESPLMQYVDENDWVTYLLLFLFPPLGIYLLWRRNRFDKPVRWAVTAASAIWFIVALILIFSGIFGGSKDNPQPANITVATTPVPTAQAVDTGTSTDDGTTSDLTGTISAATESPDVVEPTATPLANDLAQAALNASEYVYSPATGLYYHSKNDCESIPENVSVSRVPKDVAINSRKQSACPVCIGASDGADTTTYYATRGGTYYHLDQTCSGMTNAVAYTKEAAERAGKIACPVCVTRLQQSLASSAVKFITAATEDKSNITVFATAGGKYFHMVSDCSGMEGAKSGPLKAALLMGKAACPTCCPTAGTIVYCTNGGTYYHTDKDCSGMQNAAQVTLAEAMVLGKARCPVCIKTSAAAMPTSNDVYVWGTPGGKYYHTNQTCSGMVGAQRYSLKSMLQANRQACPVCAAAANTVVYATQGGTYFHSYATCSGMTDARSGTMAQAMAYGLTKCPRCWVQSGATATSASASTPSAAQAVTVASAAAGATADNTYVYATRSGAYYHISSSCNGLKDASRITLRQAINAGKTPCPTCATAANRTVYSTNGGKYYHAASTCDGSGMRNGTARKLSEALMKGQSACQYCMTAAAFQQAAVQPVTTSSDTASAATVSQRATGSYANGTSGIRVYASLDGEYYHTNKSCSGLKNLVSVTLETALNYGKRACPVCASSARRTVYATRGGRYYHYSKSHAGSGASSGTLAAALAYGFSPCPECVSAARTASSSGTYTSGASGIKVYAMLSGPYFHANATCSGMSGASYVTLETAMNYGKTPCPVCLAAAGKTVYSSSGDSYYHYYRVHAGSSAVGGTLAQARALGKRACPTCSQVLSTGFNPQGGIMSYSSAPVSTANYSAAPDTHVYIDLTGQLYYYYHKSSSCGGTGMGAGTRVTLQYAKDWGYKACPYCNPPTYISQTT